jgi:hypothetical protein
MAAVNTAILRQRSTAAGGRTVTRTAALFRLCQPERPYGSPAEWDRLRPGRGSATFGAMQVTGCPQPEETARTPGCVRLSEGHDHGIGRRLRLGVSPSQAARGPDLPRRGEFQCRRSVRDCESGQLDWQSLERPNGGVQRRWALRVGARPLAERDRRGRTDFFFLSARTAFRPPSCLIDPRARGSIWFG